MRISVLASSFQNNRLNFIVRGKVTPVGGIKEKTLGAQSRYNQSAPSIIES